jgi:amino acid permease
LLNIEIADYFTGPGVAALTFQFTGNFARDMSYSIVWAVFALALLIIGIHQRVAAVRYAGLGLLAVVIVKLFLHDLHNWSNCIASPRSSSSLPLLSSLPSCISGFSARRKRNRLRECFLLL